VGLFRTFFVAGLTIVSAVPALAEGMSVRVCNRGELAVSTAVVYEDSSLTSTFWIAEAWFTIPPNTCSTVYRDGTVCQDYKIPLGTCARVRLVYRFTDSMGVKGTADIGDPRFPPGGETMCVLGTGAFKERRSAPSSGCDRPGWFLVPVAVKIDSTRGDGPRTLYSDRFNGTTLEVALSSRDRARPFPGGDAGAVAEKPGASEAFVRLLRVATGAPTPEEERREHKPGEPVQLRAGFRWVNVCASRQFPSRELLNDPSTPRARAIAQAVRQHLDAHGTGMTGFRFVERNERWVWSRSTATRAIARGEATSSIDCSALGRRDETLVEGLSHGTAGGKQAPAGDPLSAREKSFAGVGFQMSVRDHAVEFRFRRLRLAVRHIAGDDQALSRSFCSSATSRSRIRRASNPPMSMLSRIR
jgi:hypothetical protein